MSTQPFQLSSTLSSLQRKWHPSFCATALSSSATVNGTFCHFRCCDVDTSIDSSRATGRRFSQCHDHTAHRHTGASGTPSVHQLFGLQRRQSDTRVAWFSWQWCDCVNVRRFLPAHQNYSYFLFCHRFLNFAGRRPTYFYAIAKVLFMLLQHPGIVKSESQQRVPSFRMSRGGSCQLLSKWSHTVGWPQM